MKTDKYMDIEELEKKLDKINDRLGEIREETSNLRKSGYNTHILDIKMINVGPKLRMLKATKSYEDHEKLKSILKDLWNEIEHIKKEDFFAFTLGLLNQLSIDLNKDDHESSIISYSRLREAYRELPEDLRKLIHPTCMDMFERVKMRDEK